MKAYGFWDKEQQRIVWVDGEDVARAAEYRRKNPVAPIVIQDTIDKIKHPGDGRIYESRSAYEQTSKALGLVQVDIPKDFDFNRNTMVRDLSKAEIDAIGQDIEQAAHKAYYDLRDGNQALTDEQQQYAAAVNESFQAATGKAPTVK